MMASLAELGRFALDRLGRLGRANLFLLQLLRALSFLFRRPGLLVKQLHAVGVLSLPIILVSVPSREPRLRTPSVGARCLRPHEARPCCPSGTSRRPGRPSRQESMQNDRDDAIL